MQHGDMVWTSCASVATYERIDLRTRVADGPVMWTKHGVVAMVLHVDSHWIQVLVTDMGIRWSRYHNWTSA